MDWIQSLNEAIDYIEDHILEPMTCADVANHVFISNAHFQRIFNLLTGNTIGEYLRYRRLTLAGQELLSSNERILDLAMKYGYESQESFSKAFTRFHGISPVLARKPGVHLKSFNRLTIKIVLEGGNIMEYKIVKKDSFDVVVKAKLIHAETSSSEIPAFWGEFFAEGLGEKLIPAMGICGDELNGGTEFKYGIGCPKELATEVKDFEVWTIPANTWAVFKCVGAMPDAIQTMWKRVYSEWLPKSNYELATGYDYEYNTEGDTNSPDYVSEIWLPIKEKSGK